VGGVIGCLAPLSQSSQHFASAGPFFLLLSQPACPCSALEVQYDGVGKVVGGWLTKIAA